MANKKVTLSVDPKIYDGYKKHCKDKGLIVSKQFENFIKKELENNNVKV